METVQFACAVAIAFILFHGLEGLLCIGGAGLLVRAIVFGVCFAITVMGSVVALETAQRENSLVRRAGRWLRRRSAPVREGVAGALSAVTNTKRALIELGVDVGFLVFGLLAWALLCVIYGALTWLFVHGLRQVFDGLRPMGVRWAPGLSLTQCAYAGVFFALFDEALIERVDEIINHLTREISVPARIYLRRLKAEWRHQRARSAGRSQDIC